MDTLQQQNETTNLRKNVQPTINHITQWKHEKMKDTLLTHEIPIPMFDLNVV